MVVTENASNILTLTSIKLSGRIIGEGDASVYLKGEDRDKLLIFSSENFQVGRGMEWITGFASSNKHSQKKTGKSETKAKKKESNSESQSNSDSKKSSDNKDSDSSDNKDSDNSDSKKSPKDKENVDESLEEEVQSEEPFEEIIEEELSEEEIVEEESNEEFEEEIIEEKLSEEEIIEEEPFEEIEEETNVGLVVEELTEKEEKGDSKDKGEQNKEEKQNLKEIKEKRKDIFEEKIVDYEKEQKEIKKAGAIKENGLIHNIEKATETVNLALTFDKGKKKEKILKYQEEIKAEKKAVDYIMKRRNIQLEVFEQQETDEEEILKEILLNNPDVKENNFESVCEETCFITTPLVSNFYEIIVETDPGILIEIDELWFIVK